MTNARMGGIVIWRDDASADGLTVRDRAHERCCGVHHHAGFLRGPGTMVCAA